jgi:glutamine amidotransferase-like uncharacterized protein
VLFALVTATLASVSACQHPRRVPLASTPAAPILLFNGTGTSPNDVAAIEAILNRGALAYSTADSAELNELGAARLAQHRLLIVPGGNFMTMGKSLGPRTAAKVHEAVQAGQSYLGICAGGFLAGALPYGGFDLAGGKQFGVYAVWNRGVHKAAVAISGAGTPTLEHYWEDGPQFAGWGAAVGRYPDGTPAIVEGTSGRGHVILVGVHPEAPENWRRGMTFSTPASAAQAYATTLIDAAFNGTSLPHD